MNWVLYIKTDEHGYITDYLYSKTPVEGYTAVIPDIEVTAKIYASKYTQGATEFEFDADKWEEIKPQPEPTTPTLTEADLLMKELIDNDLLK